MDPDFKAARRPKRSLRSALGEHAVSNINSETPSQTNPSPEDNSIVESSSDTPSQPMTESTAGAAVAAHHAPTKSGWRNKLRLHWPPGKKEYISLAVLVILLIGIGTAAYVLSSSSKPVAVIKLQPAKILPAPAPTTVPSTLSGLPVNPSVNKIPVTGVMIENTTDARPQSGLGQASVVFEALAEGGVTRFMALYQDTSPNNLGPVRSLRPYYEQWALGFDASIAHVGGSPDALSDISTWGVRDLDEFYNGNYYHRITSREAPHNVYTSIAELNQLETSKGYSTSTYTGFVRASSAVPAKQVTAGTINFTLSSSTYNVQYTYVPATNSYNRNEGGAPQIDANTNQQISPKVVIAMVVPETQGALDASGAYYSDYNVLGSGTAYVFQNGTVTVGSWTKSANTSQILFTNSSNQPIKLDPGQTWLTAVEEANEVNYTP